MEAEYRARTGEERFYHKYPNYPITETEYLGVGAMMIPVGLEAEVDSQSNTKSL